MRVGLFLGPALFLAMLALGPPEGLSPEGWRAGAVGVLMAVWWITEAIPIPATALVPLVLFPFLGVAPIAGAAAPYANPIIFLFLGGFIIAVALERCGLHRRLALAVLRAVGTKPANLVGGFMIATAFISMWVSNTATVVMLLPMAASVIELVEAGDPARRRGLGNFSIALLLGLAYAANIGGMGTLIGTPPNALLAGFMSETYNIDIDFVKWMAIGVPVVLIGLPITWLLLTRVLHPLGKDEIPNGREIFEREKRALGRPDRREYTVGIITTLTAAAWILQPLIERVVPGISDAGIAMTAALLMFLVPVDWKKGDFPLEWRHAEKVPWSVLLLFGGGLSLAAAIQQTGLAAWIGTSLEGVGTLPVLVVTAAITLVIIFLTELTSNAATAATFLPVVGALAVGIGHSPMLFAIPTVLAASCAFMLPVATPPNAIVFGTGRLSIPQMARAGLILNLLFMELIVAIVYGWGLRVFGIAP
jgi:sodium-dependent dicarboxylate transporter 2/3/5